MPSPSPPSLASPRLRRLAQAPAPDTRARDQDQGQQQERCDLCGAPVPREHRHLIDLETRRLMCACRPCSILFDRSAAGGGHYRLIGDRRLRLDDLELSDPEWEQLQIPVDMAFFFRDSRAGRVVAFYPSPMGATESRLELTAWTELEAANPMLRAIQPDIEALLVNRPRDGERRAWLVPIDDCYRLVALIRTRWRGFTGGKEVWQELERFFDDLDRRSRPHTQDRSRSHTRKGDEMAFIRLGKPEVTPDLPAHTPGINQGNAKGNYEKQVGHKADGRSTAARSTGVNVKHHEPIDPSMPNLSPG